ncbi:MAG: HPr kinase/phosphatase C-terminal domain-containing protein [Pseudomonadota bacterium]
MTPATETTYHATALSYRDKGLLLIGPSGSGKSSLALQMIALGALLIADDHVVLRRAGSQVMMRCPPTIAGLIEARGIGVLKAPTEETVALASVVDLGQVEKERVPPHRNVSYLGVEFPLYWRVDAPHFAAGLLHLLAHGRSSR